MHSSTRTCSLSLAAALLAVAVPRAHADEPAATVAGEEEADGSPLPFMVSSNLGYQFANRDSLSGFVNSLVVGIQFHANPDGRRHFLELGVEQLHYDGMADSDALPASYLLLGARSAYTWDRFALHLVGHLRHGDAATEENWATSSQSFSVGALASYDVFRTPVLSLALGLHATGNLVQTYDGEDRNGAATGSTGLSLFIW